MSEQKHSIKRGIWGRDCASRVRFHECSITSYNVTQHDNNISNLSRGNKCSKRMYAISAKRRKTSLKSRWMSNKIANNQRSTLTCPAILLECDSQMITDGRTCLYSASYPPTSLSPSVTAFTAPFLSLNCSIFSWIADLSLGSQDAFRNRINSLFAWLKKGRKHDDKLQLLLNEHRYWEQFTRHPCF